MIAVRCWAVALLLLPLAAGADPITFLAALPWYVNAALAVANFVATYSAYIAIGVGIARAASARRKARRAAARQRAEYNAGLSDRSVTGLASTPAWRVVYGEAITGGDIVAMFTSDKVGIRLNPFAAPRVKPDGYRHLVIVFPAHEVEQIGEVYIDGVPLGPLDAGGWVTGGEFYTDAKERAHVVSFTGSTTIPFPAGNILAAHDAANNPVTVTLSPDRKTITGPAGVAVTVHLVAYIGNAAVRCSKHAGLPSDPADPYLMSVVPDKWTSDHVLRGRAYIVLTLDLEQSRFQGGPPGITASIKGRRVYDPRKDSTRGGSGSHRLSDATTWEWSSNPALCARDWLCAPWGYKCDPLEDIDDAYTVAAANACDAVIPVGQIPPGGTEPSGDTGPMYTCNGVLMTDGGKEAQLEEILESMVGDAVYGAQWMLIAGAWTAPVGTLTDDDLHGQIEIVQAGAGTDELFNGVRGTYIPAGKAQPIDFEPYQNPTFLAADGRPLWEPVELTYVNDKQRAKIIARILVERARSSQVIKYPAKLPAWRYRVGERLNVRSTEYGLADKTYRITDWQFGLDAPVTLLLEEDAAEIWDLADAVVADPTPNTNLPSPWIVAEIAGLTADSGTAHLQLQADGTVVSRVWVSWTAIDDAYVTAGGRVRVRWLAGSQAWATPAETTGDATGVYLSGVRDGDVILIEALAINALGQEGPPVYIVHRVVGKTAAPGNVAGLGALVGRDGVQISWVANTDADYRRTRLRLGASWDSYSVEYLVPGNAYVIPFLPAGAYTVWARHEDSTGNLSAAAASATFEVTASDLVQWANVVGRPKLFRVVATGFAATSAPAGGGLYNGETGALILGPVRSYTLVRIRRSDGALTYWQHYDVLAEGTDAGNPAGAGRGSAALATDLNATGPDSIVVVYSSDEPQGNRGNNGLPAAMYRCGASRAVFGSPQFKNRCAYVLIGIGGCGEGNGFEAYQGAVDNDVNAWVDVAFQLASGQLLVTGMGATPRSLADYSYVGDLDATRGATFGVNISGQAQTSDIAAGAATQIAQVSYPNSGVVSAGGSFIPVATLTYTASATATNIATALGFLAGDFSGISGGSVDIRANMRIRLNGFTVTSDVYSFPSAPGASSGRVTGTFPFERAFSVSAGDVVEIQLLGQAPDSAFSSATIYAGTIKAEEIKR